MEQVCLREKKIKNTKIIDEDFQLTIYRLP